MDLHGSAANCSRRIPITNWCARRPTHRHVAKAFEDCNYLQALEGGIDPTHATILHNVQDRRPLVPQQLRQAGGRARTWTMTDYGFTYAGIRSHPEFVWVRAYHWIMPSYHMRGSVDGLFRTARAEIPTIDGHIWIPIDDHRTLGLQLHVLGRSGACRSRREHVLEQETRLGRGENLRPGYMPIGQSRERLHDRPPAAKDRRR